MATTYAIMPIRPAKAGEGDTYVNYPLAAAQTFELGAPLLLATGAVQEAGADPALILGFATAAHDSYDWMASTRGDVVAKVPVALADQEFRGTLEGTFAAADVGTAFGLVLDATGYWTVDRSDTSNTRVRVTGVDDGVAVGDINVPCTFVVLPANRQVTL